MAAKKKPAKKAARATRFVTFQAFGNSEVRIPLTAKNDTMDKFVRQNVPNDWNIDQLGLYVNDKPVADDYRLNDGDFISAAPNVAGGSQ